MLSLFIISIFCITSVVADQSLEITDLPTDVVGRIMGKLTFKKAFNMASAQKWNTGIENPLDRDILNPLTHHDATLDNQFALINLVKYSESPKRADHLEKLLKNPTVDPSKEGFIAFMEACTRGKLDLIQVLMKDPRIDISDSNNRAIKLIASKDSSKNKAYSKIFKMLLERLELNDRFLEAVSRGNQELVIEMLKNPYVHPGIQGNEAFKLAIVGGHAEILRILINNTRVKRRKSSHHLAMLAVKHNQLEILDIIFSEAYVPQSFLGPLFLEAVSRGNFEMVNKLLQDPRTNPAFSRNRAIYVAVNNGDIRVVERLLQHPLVDPSAEDNRALLMASRNNDVAMVELLLRNEKVFKGSLKKSFEAAKKHGYREAQRLLSGAIKQQRQTKWEGRFKVLKRKYWN